MTAFPCFLLPQYFGVTFLSDVAGCSKRWRGRVGNTADGSQFGKDFKSEEEAARWRDDQVRSFCLGRLITQNPYVLSLISRSIT